MPSADAPPPLGWISQRRIPREEDLRGPFLRDQTAILHSLPFRRLKHKTQVFFAPECDHICTRIEHVLHVSTIAVTISRGLNRHGWKLNEELAGAIGLGHDLGHAPFGHSGEFILHELLQPHGDSFLHEINGLRVVDHLANDGQGLNLTFGVRDGIICHNGEKFEPALEPVAEPNRLEEIRDRNCRPASFEGCIVRFSDKIAYLGRDLEDAIEMGLIREEDIPPAIRQRLGSRNGEIINALVIDVIEASRDGGAVRFSPDTFALVKELKEFNYRQIYFHPKLREYDRLCRTTVRTLFDHLADLAARHGAEGGRYAGSPRRLDRAFGQFLGRLRHLHGPEGDRPHRMAADYLSGMTDAYALTCMKELTLPPPFPLPPV